MLWNAYADQSAGGDGDRSSRGTDSRNRTIDLVLGFHLFYNQEADYVVL